MELEIGSKVESVNSRIDWKMGGDRIFGTVRAILQREGELVKVYWPAIKEMTFHHASDLSVVATPKKRKKKSKRRSATDW